MQAFAQDAYLSDRYGYDRELITLLTQLVRDMNRKIERQKERAVIESSAKPISLDDKARLDAIKVGTQHSLLSKIILHHAPWWRNSCMTSHDSSCVLIADAMPASLLLLCQQHNLHAIGLNLH